MVSTYDQFLNRFKNHLHTVAEFDDGEESSTMGVIVDSFIEAGLKDILDSYDELKKSSTTTEEPEKKAKKTTTRKKTTKASQQNPENSEAPQKKKNKTAYNCFVAEKIKDDNINMQKAAKIWKDMDDEARAPYAQQAKEANAAANRE